MIARHKERRHVERSQQVDGDQYVGRDLPFPWLGPASVEVPHGEHCGQISTAEPLNDGPKAIDAAVYVADHT